MTGPGVLMPASSTGDLTEYITNNSFETHVFVVTTVSFTGTLDLQGQSNSEDTTFHNARYYTFNPTSLSPSGPALGQITPPSTGIRIYIVTDPWRRLKIIKTQSGGTCAVDYFPRAGRPDLLFGNAVASGTTDSGNPTKIGGVYNSSPPTLTNGQRGDAQMDAAANFKFTLATLLSGENQTFNRLMTMGAFSVATAAAASTTTVKSGAGFMAGFIIPTLVASGTVKIYDNTAASGSVLLDTYTVPATVNTGMGPNFIPFPASFNTGLTVVMTGSSMPADILYL